MKNLIKKMSMQEKMVLSFAVPIIILYCLVNTVCYHFIVEKYEEQIRYSMDQSSAQAVSFMENYVQNMQYLANMIENSEDIQTVLRNSDFREDTGDDVQFREFYNIRNYLMELELSNPIYRLGVYVDDDKYYSENNQYFFKESLLTDRKDWEQIEKYLGNGMVYLTLTEERGVSSLTLLKQIYSNETSSEPLNICSVSIGVENIENLMENANITREGVVYLVDQNNQIIISSDSEQIRRMSEDNEIPLLGTVTDWKQVNVQSGEYFLIREDVENTNWQMISLIPMKEYQGQQAFIRIMQYLMIAIIMLLVLGTSIYLSRYYVGRLTSLKNQMNLIQTGNLNAGLPAEKENEGDEIDEIFRKFNFMVEEIRRLVQEHYQLGKEVKISELKALQAQINPHFLYNTLDLINWMAMDYGATDIENIVYNLSKFYRLSLNKGNNILTIREELEHVQVYVNIENIHFDNQIDFSVDVPEEIMDKMCLNIILQPLVENAIVHGIAEVAEIVHMTISIKAEIEGSDVVFHVEDDGIGMSPQQVHILETEYMNNAGKGYGIRNINFRLKLCYGEKYGITYNSIQGQGTKAHIRIPILNYEEIEKIMK